MLDLSLTHCFVPFLQASAPCFLFEPLFGDKATKTLCQFVGDCVKIYTLKFNLCSPEQMIAKTATVPYIASWDRLGPFNLDYIKLGMAVQWTDSFQMDPQNGITTSKNINE